MNRFSTFPPTLVDFCRNDEKFVTRIKVGPLEIEDDVPPNRSGGDEKNDGFPPDRPKLHLEVSGVGVAVEAVGDCLVEFIGVGIGNFSWEFEIEPRWSDPGSFFDGIRSRFPLKIGIAYFC